MKRRTFIAAAIGSVTGVAGLCAPGMIERRGELSTGAALAFGTTVSVTVAHPDARIAALAIADALSAAQGVDRLMSIYSEGSEVFRLNRDGVLAAPHPHVLAVLGQARALSVLTRGAFDITVQPLWKVFSAAAVNGALPPEAERRQAQSRVNWERVKVSPARVAFDRQDMAITLNGLAQGFAADLALAAVKARGVDHALLDTGEFAARGAPWTLGVSDPREEGVCVARLRMDGRCVATSGDYASAFTPDFLHHHIFDPATGASPGELASVTVVAPTAMLADGLSTACMVMGARRAHALAARLERVDLMTINKRGVIWKSAGFPSV